MYKAVGLDGTVIKILTALDNFGIEKIIEIINIFKYATVVIY